MKLSSDQEAAVKKVAQWISGATEPVFSKDKRGRDCTIGVSHEYPVLSVGGYAGTGKTTILRVLAERDARAVLVTPTHKAAQVLRGKLPASSAARVQTFHSLIYNPDPTFMCTIYGSKMQVEDCGCPGTCDCEPKLSPCMFHNSADDCDPKEELKFIKREFLAGKHTFIIVDEASMLTEREVHDLRSFGLPVLLVGDHGQLPPVKAKMNPWIEHPTVALTVNHRQGEESGIPEAAEHARTSGILSRSKYGRAVHVLRASAPESEALLERFRPDARNSTVLVQYNRTRASLNVYFRRDEQLPVIPGERLISLERQEVPELDGSGQVVNELLIHSGTLATVTQVHSTGDRYCTVEAQLDWDLRGRQDTTVLLRLATQQLGSPDNLSYRSKPGGTVLWDYAYALTAHKAQGSEFDNVIVWQETPGDKRWLYTALTRARKGLIVLT